MSLSNTEVGGFTRVPTLASKTWNTCVVDSGTLTRTEKHTLHRHSAIKRVSLEIEYESVQITGTDEYSLEDDQQSDAMQLWRENRTLWAEMEKAVSTVLAKYVSVAKSSSESLGLRTMSVPLRPVTKFNHDELSPRRDDTDARTTIADQDDLKTIILGDSPSNLGTVSLHDYIRDEVTKTLTEINHKRKSKTKSTKSH